MKLPLTDMEYIMERLEEERDDYQELLLDIFTLRCQLDISIEISSRELDLWM